MAGKSPINKGFKSSEDHIFFHGPWLPLHAMELILPEGKLPSNTMKPPFSYGFPRLSLGFSMVPSPVGSATIPGAETAAGRRLRKRWPR